MSPARSAGGAEERLPDPPPLRTSGIDAAAGLQEVLIIKKRGWDANGITPEGAEASFAAT